MFYLCSPPLICCLFFLLNITRKQKQLPWFYIFFIQLIAENCTPLLCFLFWTEFCLNKYNSIPKSTSFVLGFTSFLAWIPPELLRILQSWESSGTGYHLPPLQDFSYFAATPFPIAIKNTSLLITLLSALCKNLQITVSITTLLSMIRHLYVTAQNFQRAVGLQKLNG